MSAIDTFLPLVLDSEDEDSIQTPIVSTQEGVNFLYIRHNNLYSNIILARLFNQKWSQ